MSVIQALQPCIVSASHSTTPLPHPHGAMSMTPRRLFFASLPACQLVCLSVCPDDAAAAVAGVAFWRPLAMLMACIILMFIYVAGNTHTYTQAHTQAHTCAWLSNMWPMQFAFASQLQFALFALLQLPPLLLLLFISLHTQLRLPVRIRFSLTHFRLPPVASCQFRSA